MALTYDVRDDVPAEAGGIVDAGLGRSNDAAAPLGEVRGLSCFAWLPSGALIGGAVGRTGAECCRTFYLETFNFQAPSLYRSLGYESASEIRGFPQGIVKHLMVR